MKPRNHPYTFVVPTLFFLAFTTAGSAWELGSQTVSSYQAGLTQTADTSIGTGSVRRVAWWNRSSNRSWFRRWRPLQDPATPVEDPQVPEVPVETQPLPKLSVSDAQLVEGDAGQSHLTFVVSLDGPANGYVDAAFTTSDATATLADRDYVAADGRVTIAAGYTSAEVQIGIQGDTNIEDDETFILTLSDVSANAELERAVATATILNDETPAEYTESLRPLPRGIISHGAKGRPIDQEILDNLHVNGFLVLAGWNDIEPVEGVFNWEHIDSEVARAKAAGKVVKLTIHAGGDSAPAWIFENYPQVKSVIWYDKVTGEKLLIPAYWDPEYVRIKSRFIAAVGERYRDIETIFATSVSMVDPNTNDWAFVVRDDAQAQSYLDSGFTEAAFVSAYKQLIDAGMAAFPNQYVVTAVGPIPRVLVKDKFAAVHQVLDYAYAAYGERFIIAKGALHAAIPDPVDSDGTAWETMRIYSPNTAGQFVWGVTRDPDYKMNGRVPYSANEMQAVFRKAAEKGKDYGMRWIEPWRIDLLNPDLQDEIVHAASLLGGD